MITLPTTPKVREMQVQVVDYSTDLRPPFGGPVQTIHRLGDRYAITFGLPPMLASSAEARAWMVCLTIARRSDAWMNLPLDGVNIGLSGICFTRADVAAHATTIPIHANSGYVWKQGQWLTFTYLGADGETRGELHQIANSVAADGAGNCSIELTLPTRIALPSGTNAEVMVPGIVGRVTTPASWSTDVAAWMAAPSFTIEERR